MTSEEDFAPIWEESILLEEHEAVQASVDVGGWLSAALDDPNVCDQMKADINRWFSAGFLYLDNVRQLMQADREAVRAEQAAEIVKERERADKFMWQVRDTCARAERAEQELAKFKALAETLAEAVREIKDSWDWWQVDTYDRCSSVVEDAINEALRQYKEATNV